jgi:hypothetical protein
MTSVRQPCPTFLRGWLVWIAGFLAFPVGGWIATLVVGPLDSTGAALLGGAITGTVIGTGQALSSSRRIDGRRWIPVTAIGMSLGLALGSMVVGYRTSLADLAVMGALTGLVLGVAQTYALPAHTVTRWLWAAATPVTWTMGWIISTLVITTAVGAQFFVFGASGAVIVAALSGLLLHLLLPPRPQAAGADAAPDQAPSPTAATP